MEIIVCPNCGSTAQVKESKSGEYICGCGYKFKKNNG